MLYIFTVAYLANKDVTALRLAHLLKSTVPVPYMGGSAQFNQTRWSNKRKLRIIFHNKLAVGNGNRNIKL
jgi:hypothetical protein